MSRTSSFPERYTRKHPVSREARGGLYIYKDMRSGAVTVCVCVFRCRAVVKLYLFVKDNEMC